MKQVRMLGLCLVAALAIAAVAATSASAAPEFGQCYVQAKHEGTYTDSNCTKKAKRIEVEGATKFTGEYEWRKESELPEKNTNLLGGVCKPEGCSTKDIWPPMTMYVTNKENHAELLKVHCGEMETSAYMIGPKEVAWTLELNEHPYHAEQPGENRLSLRNCFTSTGEECGLGGMDWFALAGHLGYINKAKKEVGITMFPQKKGGLVASFTCGFRTHVEVGEGPKGGADTMIYSISPVNQMTTLLSVTATQSEGVQIPNKFEGSGLKQWEALLNTALETLPWADAGVEHAQVLETKFKREEAAEPIEIKA
jgi:hypothetical protein